MNSRSMRKIVLGSTLVALLVMAGMLIWAIPGEQPRDGLGALVEHSEPAPDHVVGELPVQDEVPGAAKQLPADDRHLVVGVPESSRGTSLLVRVVRRETNNPVTDFPLNLIPEGTMSLAFGNDVLEGTTDDRGEVLWENINWGRAMIFPALGRDYFDIEPGQLNERVHEIELGFTIDGQVVDPRGQPVAGATIWTFFDDSAFRGITEAAVTDGEGRFSLPILGSTGIFAFARSQGRRVVRKQSRPSSAVSPRRERRGRRAGVCELGE